MVRYLPTKTLPPYSYVSGRYPHPHRDLGGHSHGIDVREAVLLSETNWRACHSYLWGVDLFNEGYYWEAHEAWEQAWITAGRSGAIADFLKALIKLAAAGVKAREGRTAGVQRHANRSLELLTSTDLSSRHSYLGQSLIELRSAVQDVVAQAASITANACIKDQAHELPVHLQLVD